MKHQKLSGFTMVEGLITLTILILSLACVFAVYLAGQKFYQRAEVRAELLQNGRVILERLAREIRQAEEIVTALPQVPDNPDRPPPSEIEFQDGHFPSPFQGLGSDYYYIRYYLATSSREVYRQYRVYCFDPCAACSAYFRWNDTKIIDGQPVQPQPCNLEERVIGEYVKKAEFWGAEIINISLLLNNFNEELNLKTRIFGRNL